MKEALYAIYGMSGHGREVMPLAREQLHVHGVSSDRLVFVDDNPTAKLVNNQRVLTYSEFLNEEATERYAVLAIANSAIREKLAGICQNDGVLWWSVQANNILMMDEVKIGVGAILSPFVTLNSNIQIGNHFHVNTYSYVAHDCIIGNYVTLAPGVKCNGNVIIEDHAYIGTGAIIKQGKPGKPTMIGKGAIIGMGAVVTKDVAPGTTVVGNPAKELIKN